MNPPADAPIDYVVFDLGGVVLRETDGLRDLAERIGAPSDITAAEFRSAYYATRLDYDLHSDSELYWTQVALACGASEPRSADIADLTAIDNVGWSHVDSATMDLIVALYRAGVALAVLSNAPAAMGDMIRGQSWAGMFQHIVISGEIGMIKPDLAIYEALLKALDVPAPTVAFTDDRADNVAGAAAAGIRGIPFTGADALRQRLQNLGVSI
ncbi:MAG: HAD-IA family hydrolase [Actinobacteria bacterium]|nr:HAD-IA family hydrolase [Actinomycetota bacterium]